MSKWVQKWEFYKIKVFEIKLFNLSWEIQSHKMLKWLMWHRNKKKIRGLNQGFLSADWKPLWGECVPNSHQWCSCVWRVTISVNMYFYLEFFFKNNRVGSLKRMTNSWNVNRVKPVFYLCPFSSCLWTNTHFLSQLTTLFSFLPFPVKIDPLFLLHPCSCYFHFFPVIGRIMY